jgi:hypothetical protein
MVRLMLVLAPVMCILSGIGISSILYSYMKNLDTAPTSKSSSASGGSSSEKKRKSDDNYPKKSEVKYIDLFSYCIVFVVVVVAKLFLILDCRVGCVFYLLFPCQLHIPLHMGHVRGLLESVHSAFGQESQRRQDHIRRL